MNFNNCEKTVNTCPGIASNSEESLLFKALDLPGNKSSQRIKRSVHPIGPWSQESYIAHSDYGNNDHVSNDKQDCCEVIQHDSQPDCDDPNQEVPSLDEISHLIPADPSQIVYGWTMALNPHAIDYSRKDTLDEMWGDESPPSDLKEYWNSEQDEVPGDMDDEEDAVHLYEQFQDFQTSESVKLNVSPDFKPANILLLTNEFYLAEKSASPVVSSGKITEGKDLRLMNADVFDVDLSDVAAICSEALINGVVPEGIVQDTPVSKDVVAFAQASHNSECAEVPDGNVMDTPVSKDVMALVQASHKSESAQVPEGIVQDTPVSKDVMAFAQASHNSECAEVPDGNVKDTQVSKDVMALVQASHKSESAQVPEGIVKDTPVSKDVMTFAQASHNSECAQVPESIVNDTPVSKDVMAFAIASHTSECPQVPDWQHTTVEGTYVLGTSQDAVVPDSASMPDLYSLEEVDTPVIIAEQQVPEFPPRCGHHEGSICRGLAGTGQASGGRGSQAPRSQGGLGDIIEEVSLRSPDIISSDEDSQSDASSLRTIESAFANRGSVLDRAPATTFVDRTGSESHVRTLNGNAYGSLRNIPECVEVAEVSESSPECSEPLQVLSPTTGYFRRVNHRVEIHHEREDRQFFPELTDESSDVETSECDSSQQVATISSDYQSSPNHIATMSGSADESSESGDVIEVSETTDFDTSGTEEENSQVEENSPLLSLSEHSSGCHSDRGSFDDDTLLRYIDSAFDEYNKPSVPCQEAISPLGRSRSGIRPARKRSVNEHFLQLTVSDSISDYDSPRSSTNTEDAVQSLLQYVDAACDSSQELNTPEPSLKIMNVSHCGYGVTALYLDNNREDALPSLEEVTDASRETPQFPCNEGVLRSDKTLQTVEPRTVESKRTKYAVPQCEKQTSDAFTQTNISGPVELIRSSGLQNANSFGDGNVFGRGKPVERLRKLKRSLETLNLHAPNNMKKPKRVTMLGTGQELNFAVDFVGLMNYDQSKQNACTESCHTTESLPANDKRKVATDVSSTSPMGRKEAEVIESTEERSVYTDNLNLDCLQNSHLDGNLLNGSVGQKTTVPKGPPQQVESIFNWYKPLCGAETQLEEADADNEEEEEVTPTVAPKRQALRLGLSKKTKPRFNLHRLP